MKETTTAILLAVGILVTAASCGTEPAETGRAVGVASGVTDVVAPGYTSSGELIRPNVDAWVFLGASLGHAYSDVDFSEEQAGTFQIVHMEPSAYAFFVENGEYADGSMFSLSFYDVQQKPEPELSGFAQGDLVSFEVHVIHDSAFADGRAFYLFGNDDNAAAMVPPGNDCVQCHNEHAEFDGTFTQFYPVLRSRLGG